MRKERFGSFSSLDICLFAFSTVTQMMIPLLYQHIIHTCAERLGTVPSYCSPRFMLSVAAPPIGQIQNSICAELLLDRTASESFSLGSDIADRSLTETIIIVHKYKKR